MELLPTLLILSLALPALCLRKPEDYGFYDNRDGSYVKTIKNRDDSTYTIAMRINDNGVASFNVYGNVVGNGIGSISNGQYMVEGYGRPGIPITGWKDPKPSNYGTDRQDFTSFNGELDVDNHIRRMTESMGSINPQFRSHSGFATINNVGDMQGNRNGGVFGSSSGTFTINNAGNYYSIQYVKSDNGGQCTEKFTIKGRPGAVTRTISDVFQPECKKDVIRAQHYSRGELLVGGPGQNFCAYGQISFPDQLIVIQDGNCKIKTYTITDSSTKDLDTGKCETVKNLIKSVQDVLEGRSPATTLQNSQQQLSDLVTTEINTAGGNQSTSGRPNSPAKPPVSSNTPKKKHGFFKSIWIFIKNIFRKLTGRPTKDE